MYDSGAHIFNSLVWSIEAPIETVFAMTDNLGTPVDINSVVAIKFKNGVLATMTINGNSDSAGAGMVYILPMRASNSMAGGGAGLKRLAKVMATSKFRSSWKAKRRRPTTTSSTRYWATPSR